jgi:hypothetical protein
VRKLFFYFVLFNFFQISYAQDSLVWKKQSGKPLIISLPGNFGIKARDVQIRPGSSKITLFRKPEKVGILKILNDDFERILSLDYFHYENYFLFGLLRISNFEYYLPFVVFSYFMGLSQYLAY